jgi:hypothetical protein
MGLLNRLSFRRVCCWRLALAVSNRRLLTGNLAAVTILKAVKAELHVNLRAQMLMVPVCDNTATSESETWSQRPYAPLLTPERMTFPQRLCLGPRHSPTWGWGALNCKSSSGTTGLYYRNARGPQLLLQNKIFYTPESFEFAKRFKEQGIDVDPNDSINTSKH